MQTLAEYKQHEQDWKQHYYHTGRNEQNSTESEWAINFKEGRMLTSSWTQMNNLVLSGHGNCYF